MSKNTINIIRTKTNELLTEIKNGNNLLDIIMLLEDEDIKVQTASIRSLHRVFVHLIKQGSMVQSAANKNVAGELSAEAKYSQWLEERYTDTRTKLLEFLHVSNSNIQELALCTLMKFVEEEGKAPLKKLPESHISFPTYFFNQVVKQLLSSDVDMVSVIGRFQEFLEYDDVRYTSMKATLQMLNSESTEVTNVWLHNVFSLIKGLCLPAEAPENGHLTKFMSKLPENTGLKINTFKEHRKLFTTLWLKFLKLQLPTSLYKKVLLVLHEDVMVHMTSPLLLSDFLTQSYNIGGAISLLALNGIFILVNKYNLDYPDFYNKLYALFDANVFHVKYRARFFYLADLFLTSSHLPAYLVAAFIKRLSRLSLTAPPSGLTVILPFVYNLMTRHPACDILVRNKDTTKELSSDPYNMEETDPAKCRALESTLWEIQTLQSHFHHTVSGEAKKIEQPLSRIESDISELLEVSIDSLIDHQRKKKVKFVPTTFEAPSGLFKNNQDQLNEFWSLT